MYETTLQHIGLKPAEIKAYVTLLQLGPQPASVVARHIQGKRTTVLVHLQRLAKIGFVRITLKGRQQYFAAEKPEEAVIGLETQKNRHIEEWDKKIRALSAVAPELNAISREESYFPRVTFYEGIDQLKRMYTDSLHSQGEILCLSKVQDMWDLFGQDYDQWYVAKRVKNKIPLRYIAIDSPVEFQERQKDRYFMRESRLIPKHFLDISNEINIYDDKVSIITFKQEKIGVLIQSKQIAHFMKGVFENLWRVGKKPD